MGNNLFTHGASLPLLCDVWVPYVSFIFNLRPSPRSEGRGGARAESHAARGGEELVRSPGRSLASYASTAWPGVRLSLRFKRAQVDEGV